jgi:cytochrome c
MNKVLKALTVLLILIVIGCGGDKKVDPFENEVVENKTSSTLAVPSAEKGKKIFEGKGACATCHKLDSKVIGPSILDIAKIYKEKNANMVLFLKGEREPLVDPSQYEVMKANIALTKSFSDEELQSLEQYIYSQLK